MKSKLIKTLITSLVVSLMLGLMGSFALASKKELTPLEWSQLKWQDKLKEKTIVITDSIFGAPDWIEEKNLPTDVTNVREKIHSGDILTPRTWYNIALFETAYPKVYVKPTTFNPWSRESYSQLSARIAAGNAPSLYYLLVPTQAMETGLAADITDLVSSKEWQNTVFRDWAIPVWKRLCWIGDRCYGLFNPVLYFTGAIYRKDLFKEAGVFNEKGEAGPPEDWTWQEYSTICRKLTNVKKQRWGGVYRQKLCAVDIRVDNTSIYAGSHGWPLVGMDNTPVLIQPDKTGKYTWKFGSEPFAKAIKFWHDLIWKEKTVLFSESVDAEFTSGRAAIMIAGTLPRTLVLWGIGQPHRFDPVKETKDILGGTLAPRAEYGLRHNTMYTDPIMFDPTLSKEQLKAALDWTLWNTQGMGFQITQFVDFGQRNIGIKTAGMWNGYYRTISTPYRIETSSLAEKEIAKLRKEYPKITSKYEELFQKASSFPVIPSPRSYGLIPSDMGIAEIKETEMQVRDSLIATPKELTLADIKAEIEKAGEKINKKVLNFKIKGDKEKFQAYFKAVDEFYKKNFPKFYGSKDYEENFVSYFKF